MSHPFNHPSSETLFERVAQPLKNGKIFMSRARPLVFLCGGAAGRNQRTFRKRFLTYSRSNLKEYQIFLAEDANKDIVNNDNPKFINIAEFEEILAGVADCIIIFLESPGSFAEAGYFSKDQAIAEKLLIAIPIKYFDDSSFINRGPIDKIGHVSAFKPAIPLPNKKPYFDSIKSRLIDVSPPKTRKRLEFKSYNEYTHKERFFILLHVAWTLSVCDLDTILYAVEKIIGDCNKDDVRHLISVLLACGYLRRVPNDEDFLYVPVKTNSYLEVEGSEPEKNRMAVRSFYEKHSNVFRAVMARIP